MMAKRRKKKRSRRGLLIAVMVLAVGGSGFALSRSRLFGVSSIEVLGTTQRDAVIAASGIDIGENVMGINLDAAAKRIELLPTVSEARVVRDGALGIRIQVVERYPALEARSGDQRWFLGQDGVTVETEPANPVPLLLLPEGETPDGEAAAGVLDVWRRLPPKLRSGLASFSFSPGGTISFELRGVTVVFGRAERVKAKVTALQLVLDRIRRSGQTLVAVDVRSPQHPAVRLA